MIKHDNAISSWITLSVARNGAVTTVLMIETDLSLDAKDPSYKKENVDSLIAAAVANVRGHPHIDTIEIGPLQQGNVEVTSIGY